MAGGGVEGGRELDHTPTWAVSLVCGVIIIISILLEKTLHKVGETFSKRRKMALVEALEKIKAELMILGGICASYICTWTSSAPHLHILFSRIPLILWGRDNDAREVEGFENGKYGKDRLYKKMKHLMVCFFRHILYSVQRPDYLTLRHGFVSVHLSSGMKFDFQKYIKRSLEDDFKVVVGIPPYLWMTSLIYLLVNVKGGEVMFLLSIFPLLAILAVGTKLQSIITQMAIEIQEKHAVVQGIPLVQVSDRHFCNAFEITYFIWITYEFGLHSCFHRYFILAVIRVGIGVGVQVLCSYITLPLYALVTQMGSHMKKSIFDEQTSKALMNWHNKVKKKTDNPKPRTRKLGGSPEDSPEHSPRGFPMARNNTGESSSGVEMTHRESTSPKEMIEIDLLSGP
ncbi:hypothetical protein OROHE_009023 [Orobanche hederae]